MRILHISTRLILGGSQENTVLSCEGQARLGHEVHLAFGPIYGPEGSLLDRVLAFNAACLAGTERVRPIGDASPSREPGAAAIPITTHVVPSLVRDLQPLADRRALRELRALIATLKPDIVHTHSSKAGILGRVAAWNAHPPAARPPARSAIIHTIHGPPFMPVEGPPLARLKTRLLNHVYTLAERHAAARCDAIVSVADAMTREFLRRGIGHPNQYTTVRSGMDVEPFLTPAPGESRAQTRLSLALAPSDFVVGTVARLAQHKGHDDLLDALAQDLRDNPRWKLLWVGDGWWRARLIDKARARGVGVLTLDASARIHPHAQTSPKVLDDPTARAAPPQLILTGLVPPQRIPALVRAMDVLAHPSYREGLPRTVPQALLAGVCPVVYDVDGAGEVCRDMQTGRLVPLANLARLRDAIRWCFDHPDERTELAARGQAECRAAFSADTMTAALERVYHAAHTSPKRQRGSS
ncbi:MAG: glycosyltransferase [Planctomycetota bacterium]|nr:glycosyltransferase [Planctomycetota bacterium]